MLLITKAVLDSWAVWWPGMDTKVGCWWKNSGAGGDREALYSRKKGEWKVKEPSHCLWPSFTPSGQPRRSQALQLDERSQIASAFGLLEEANKNPLWREKKKQHIILSLNSFIQTTFHIQIQIQKQKHRHRLKWDNMNKNHQNAVTQWLATH